VVTDQVRAAHMDVNILGYINTHELLAKMFGRMDVMRRDYTVLNDLLVVVEVVQKQVQRGYPLSQSAFDMSPFPLRNDARNQIEGKDPFRAGIVAIDGKGNSLSEKRGVDCRAFVFKFLHRERAQTF